jgi:hypothetical protein
MDVGQFGCAILSIIAMMLAAKAALYIWILELFGCDKVS